MRNPYSVCVFCASHPARSSVSRAFLQRRQLQFSSSAHRPAHAAASQQEDVDSGPRAIKGSTTSSQPSPPALDDGLTEEERAIKSALQKASRKRQEQGESKSQEEKALQHQQFQGRERPGDGSGHSQGRSSIQGGRPRARALNDKVNPQTRDIPGGLGERPEAQKKGSGVELSQRLFDGNKGNRKPDQPDQPDPGKPLIRQIRHEWKPRKGDIGKPLLAWQDDVDSRRSQRPGLTNGTAHGWTHVRRVIDSRTQGDIGKFQAQTVQAIERGNTGGGRFGGRREELSERQSKHSDGRFVGFDDVKIKAAEESRQNTAAYSPYRSIVDSSITTSSNDSRVQSRSSYPATERPKQDSRIQKPYLSNLPPVENVPMNSVLEDNDRHRTRSVEQQQQQQGSRTATPVKSDFSELPRYSDGSYAERGRGGREFVSRRSDRRRGQDDDKKVFRRQEREADEDDDDELATRIERKRQRKLERQRRKEAEAAPVPILLPEFISIGNLASALKVRVEAFSRKLSELGFSETNNDHIIDAETAGLIASEFNFEPILPSTSLDEDLVAQPPADDQSLLMSRPPVVTIMGHVDHGKTTLLDYLRKSSVAASEHGGITQHIGAFTVSMPSGRDITFLDTPGHAAFLSMRARGAHVTDIVILVVAADDSVKPQTIEAIKHAREARVPMIVAINKIDKEDANPEKVKQDLARHNVEVEDYGGETQTVNVSGKTGEGMEELEDAAVALADILDVRADTSGQVEGWVLEAARKNSGKVATMLVRRGTLTPGTILVAGSTWTRVRTLRNEAGVVVDSAGPGTPVEVDGWREQPEAGAEALQAPDEQRARRVVDLRIERAESTRLAQDVLAVNEQRRAEESKRAAEAVAEKRAQEGDTTPGEKEEESVKLNEVPLVVRADVSGSVEALTASILGLGNAEIRPSLLRSDVGPLSPSDIDLAAVAKGNVVSFNVPVENSLRAIAERQGVKIIDGNVIYRVVEDIRVMLEDKLPPLISKRVIGEALIAQEFEIGLGGSKKLKVAGVKVKNGNIRRNAKVRVLREGETIYDGTLYTLKSQKKEVQEMSKGSEAGLSFTDFAEFLPGDQIQSYETVTEKRTL